MPVEIDLNPLYANYPFSRYDGVNATNYKQSRHHPAAVYSPDFYRRRAKNHRNYGCIA